MDSEELREFVNGNREAIEKIIQEEKAKRTVEDNGRNAEDIVNKIFAAFADQEFQKHLVAMGVEAILALDALARKFPVPENLQEAEKAVRECRKEVTRAYCSRNPDCKNPCVEKIDITESEEEE